MYNVKNILGLYATKEAYCVNPRNLIAGDESESTKGEYPSPSWITTSQMRNPREWENLVGFSLLIYFIANSLFLWIVKKQGKNPKNSPAIAIVAYNMKGCLRFSTFISWKSLNLVKYTYVSILIHPWLNTELPCTKHPHIFPILSSNWTIFVTLEALGEGLKFFFNLHNKETNVWGFDLLSLLKCLLIVLLFQFETWSKISLHFSICVFN
jgi:hypothetical protein